MVLVLVSALILANYNSPGYIRLAGTNAHFFILTDSQCGLMPQKCVPWDRKLDKITHLWQVL